MLDQKGPVDFFSLYVLFFEFRPREICLLPFHKLSMHMHLDARV